MKTRELKNFDKFYYNKGARHLSAFVDKDLNLGYAPDVLAVRGRETISFELISETKDSSGAVIAWHYQVSKHNYLRFTLADLQLTLYNDTGI
jgi:hypothetical protein